VSGATSTILRRPLSVVHNDYNNNNNNNNNNNT
jgi:hypothetical protein